MKKIKMFFLEAYENPNGHTVPLLFLISFVLSLILTFIHPYVLGWLGLPKPSPAYYYFLPVFFGCLVVLAIIFAAIIFLIVPRHAIIISKGERKHFEHGELIYRLVFSGSTITAIKESDYIKGDKIVDIHGYYHNDDNNRGNHYLSFQDKIKVGSVSIDTRIKYLLTGELDYYALVNFLKKIDYQLDDGDKVDINELIQFEFAKCNKKLLNEGLSEAILSKENIVYVNNYLELRQLLLNNIVIPTFDFENIIEVTLILGDMQTSFQDNEDIIANIQMPELSRVDKTDDIKN